MSVKRHSFLGIPIDDCTMSEAVDEAISYVETEMGGYILFLNTDVIVKADQNNSLNDAISASSLSLMDGKPLLLLARAKGVPIREKVSGSDFVPLLLKAASEKRYSVFFLGGSEIASKAAAENVCKDFPNLSQVWSYSPPMGFEQSIDGIVEAVERVRDARPDILIICLGCPKQELLARGLFDEFGVHCIVCAGATVDFLAGTAKRAPDWVSEAGLEWLYRFLHEPKRLFRRYFVDSWHLVSMVKTVDVGGRMGIRSYALKAMNNYYWCMDKLAKQRYIREYPKYLRKLGVKISEEPGDCWISPTIFLDSAGYDMIEIGDNCTISFDVVILVHDYSINNAMRVINEPEAERHRVIKRPVKIGSNCFIGARAIVMPGAEIGDNCIVGSGAVVRGKIPAGKIVSGNPAVVIADVSEFGKRHLTRGDWTLDER